MIIKRSLIFFALFLWMLCSSNTNAQTTVVRRDSPVIVLKNNFRITFSGLAEFDVVAVKGLVSETVVERKDLQIRSKKELKPAHLIVVRRAQNPDILWEWRRNIIAGKDDKRNGQVILLDRDGNETLKYTIFQAWPYKWIWPQLDASDTSPAYEEIHFYAEKIEPLNIPSLNKSLRVIE